MVGSRSSQRIAQRLIKQEPQDNDAPTPPKETPKKKSAKQSQPLAEEKVFRVESLLSSDSDNQDGNDVPEDDGSDEEEEEDVVTPRKRAMNSQSRGTKNQPGELNTARLKLNDVLAHIANGEHDDEYDDYDDNETELSPPAKQRRIRGPRKSRKKSRDDGFGKASSFILRLFDRSVDLAQFCLRSSNEDTPLYPVCRAWIKNQSLSTTPFSSPFKVKFEADEQDSTEKPAGVWNLPAPVSKRVDSNGNVVEIRIPKIATRPEVKSEDIDIMINSRSEDSNMSGLLNQNMSRWKQVRAEWKQAANMNELRYVKSFNILKELHRSQTTQQDGDTTGKSNPGTSDGQVCN